MKEPKKEAESYRYDFTPNGIDLAQFSIQYVEKDHEEHADR